MASQSAKERVKKGEEKGSAASVDDHDHDHGHECPPKAGRKNTPNHQALEEKQAAWK